MTDSTTTVTPWRKKAGRIAQWALLSLLLIVALVWGGRWLVWRMGHVVTDAGFVKADITEVAPELPGKVTRVYVKEGDQIQAGELLFELDADELSDREGVAAAEVAFAEAKIGEFAAKQRLAEETVPAQIKAAEAAAAAARGNLRQAQAQRDYLAKQQRRFAALLADQAIGRARFDEIDAALQSAEAAVSAAEAQSRAAEAKVAEARGAQAKIPEAAAGKQEAEQGRVKAVQALNLARTLRAKTKVTAPVPGVIARVFIEQGDFAAPGRPAVALYDPRSLYVEARFEETKLTHLRPGQRVELSLDYLSGKPLYGTVRLIHRASAGEFALIPRDVTAGEFTKLTQRIPVDIDFEEPAHHDDLVPGLSVFVVAPRGGRDAR